MSIAELDVSSYSGRSDGPDDRVPPQDLHAEQSRPRRHAAVQGRHRRLRRGARGNDFYRPAHELIYDAILDLYGRGEPADAITVSDELTKRGDLHPGRRPGLPAPADRRRSRPRPTPATTPQIVAERAVLRRLVEAGTRIVQLGYGQGGGDVEDIVNAAQAEVYAVADKRGGEDYHVLGDVLEATVDEIEAASGRSRRDGRRAHRLHRPRRADQRPAPRPDDRRRRPAGRRQVDAGRSTSPGRRRSSTSMATVVFSPRDEPHRDHHAPAVGRGRHPAAGPAQGHDARRGLDQAGPHHGRGLRRAAVHRRLAQHVADGDPGQVPPAQAAAQPQAGRSSTTCS